MKALSGVLVVLILLVAGCVQAPGLDDDPSDQLQPTETHAPTPSNDSDASDESPPDPDEDVLGWEDGYWHNESIDVDPSDGLNESELDIVVARSMARVEHVRGLEFQESVPVTIISREEYRQQRMDDRISPALRRFDNVKFRALFLIDEETDSIQVQDENRGSAVLGYYSPEENEIVVISEGDSAQIDEYTLGHELVHALQDQHFDLLRYDARTRDQANAQNGLIEGDARYTERLYENECEAADGWECLPTVPQGGSGQGQLANVGVYLIDFQPYSDGPVFVRDLYEESGWEAVNDRYENPPRSTSQIVHSDREDEIEPVDVSLEDTSTDDWERIRPPDRPDSGSVGEVAVFTMFMYPYYDSEGREQVIPADQFFNYEGDQLREIDPLNFSHPYSDGLRGDHMLVYSNDADETAYAWTLAFASEDDAAEFVTGYERLLDYWNAEAVENRENTWRIAEDRRFSGAYYVQQQGDTVVIVNAPSADELSDVREGAAPTNE